MWKWIKKIFTNQEPELKRVKSVLSVEEEEQKLLELVLLQDPICAKHHG